jgi:hypothetical protein
VIGGGNLRSVACGGEVRDVVFLLWPAQPVAVIEITVGRLMATVVAVGVNVAIFAIVGMAAGFWATRRPRLLALLVAILGLLLWLALWGAGFDWSYMSVRALACAFLLQAVLFWAADRTGRATQGQEPGE